MTINSTLQETIYTSINNCSVRCLVTVDASFECEQSQNPEDEVSVGLNFFEVGVDVLNTTNPNYLNSVHRRKVSNMKMGTNY